MPLKRILVIDDDDVIQEIVQNCLEDVAGWQVLLASSGWEGLKKAIAEQPDAIVLDVMMPGMDGITFLNLLRTNSQVQAIPVVLLTAKVDLTARDRLGELGVLGVIAKPFGAIELVEQIAGFLGWTFVME